MDPTLFTVVAMLLTITPFESRSHESLTNSGVREKVSYDNFCPVIRYLRVTMIDKNYERFDILVYLDWSRNKNKKPRKRLARLSEYANVQQ